MLCAGHVVGRETADAGLWSAAECAGHDPLACLCPVGLGRGFVFVFFFFFFSSRRRHTRFDCDWIQTCALPIFGDAAGAVLAKLKFAVVPAGSADDALRIMQTMRPDIVTANAEDAARIQRERPEQDAVVVVGDAMRDNAQLLVDQIRAAIRSSPTGSAA